MTGSNLVDQLNQPATVDYFVLPSSVLPVFKLARYTLKILTQRYECTGNSNVHILYLCSIFENTIILT